MGGKEILRRLAGVILGPILDQEEGRVGLRQDVDQKGDVAFSIEALNLALPEQATREELDQTEDLVPCGAHWF